MGEVTRDQGKVNGLLSELQTGSMSSVSQTITSLTRS